MANWIRTTVKAKNFEVLKEKLLRLPTTEELAEDRELSADKLIIDFNILIPRPTDLNITAGSHEWKIPSRFDSIFGTEKLGKQNRLIKPILDRIYHNNTEVTQAEFVKKVNRSLATHLKTFVEVYEIRTDDTTRAIKSYIENIVKGYYNYKKYGYVNWYEWSYDNWGTKWNGGMPNSINEEKGTITFETANGLAFPVLKELSKYTPIVVIYANEDMGRDYGIFSLVDGEVKEVLNDSNEDKGEAFACRGYNIEDIDDYYCEDNYTDEEMEEYFGMSREDFIENAHNTYNDTKELIESLF